MTFSVAVGDVNQSIYGFRHARPEIFYGYSEEVVRVGKHSAELLDNFAAALRFWPAWMLCSKALWHRSETSERSSRVRREKQPLDRSAEGLSPDDPDEESDEGREARWITSRILAAPRHARSRRRPAGGLRRFRRSVSCQ